MDDTTGYIVGAVVVVVWGAWTLFSETRHNHGILIAFLLPLALLLMPVVWTVFVLIKYASLLVFTMLGRKDDHEEFMRQLRVRSGVFLLF